MLTSLRLGMDFALACPEGYLPNPDIVTQAEGLAAVSGATLLITHDTTAAVNGAHAVYTDVWTSMGQEEETAARRAAFAGFTVDDEMLRCAHTDAWFLHCLPAHRGEEVAATAPRVISMSEAEPLLSPARARFWRSMGIEHCLFLQVAPPAQPTSRIFFRPWRRAPWCSTRGR